MQFALLFVSLTDPVPTDNQVKAGPAAAIVFILLLVAVAALGFSLRRQFKKVQAAREAGLYGDAERTEAASDDEAADQTGDQASDQAGDGTASDADADQNV